MREANSLGSPDASSTAYTLYPLAFASSAGKATHTLVHTPAMISVLRPVFLTVLTNSSFSHALIPPLRGTNVACGAFAGLEFPHQRSIRAVWHGRRGDHRDSSIRAPNLRQGSGIGTPLGNADVFHRLKQPGLVVEQHQDSHLWRRTTRFE